MHNFLKKHSMTEAASTYWKASCLQRGTVRDKVTRWCPQTTTFEETELTQGPYQPNAVPLGQAGAYERRMTLLVLLGAPRKFPPICIYTLVTNLTFTL